MILLEPRPPLGPISWVKRLADVHEKLVPLPLSNGVFLDELLHLEACTTAFLKISRAKTQDYFLEVALVNWLTGDCFAPEAHPPSAEIGDW